MGDIDPEIKNLRIYTDHQLNNLRMGLEGLQRVCQLLRRELERLKEECKRQKSSAEVTETHTPHKSLTTAKVNFPPAEAETRGTYLSRFGSEDFPHPPLLEPLQRYKKY